MAHQSRSHWFPHFKKMLGSDVKFSVDDGSLGVWGNCERAWSMVDPNADYGFIIQDDAILCNNFVSRLRSLIETNPNKAYQLCFATRQASERIISTAKTLDENYIELDVLYGGVAVGLPTPLIPKMLKYTTKLTNIPQDDTRIKLFLKHNKTPVVYPHPSLVDHRFSVSLVTEYSRPERRAHAFIDRKTIPKIIHHINLSGQNTQAILSWQNIPKWSNMIWDQNSIKSLYSYPQYLENKNSDKGFKILLAEILYLYGGLYIQNNIIRTKTLKNYTFFDYGFLTLKNAEGQYIDSILGATPYHDISLEYATTPIHSLITQHISDPDVCVLDQFWFNPYHNNTRLRYHQLSIAKTI